MFGKISEATKKVRHADVAFSTENWGVVDEGKGFVRLLRPSQSARGVAIGRLIGMRLGAEGTKFLAVVREIVQELEGSIFVVLVRLPGEPEAIAVRSTDMRNRPASQFVQGFRLPAVPDLKEPETLIIPSGLAQPGRGIDVIAQGEGECREVTLHEFVERGSDFERVTTY